MVELQVALRFQGVYPPGWTTGACTPGGLTGAHAPD